MEYWPEFVNKYPELDMQQWVIREYAKQIRTRAFPVVDKFNHEGKGV
jgi:hypothetical protein